MHSVRRVPCLLPAILANFLLATESARAFHEMGRRYHDRGSSWRRIDVSGPGGKTRKAGRGNVRRLRAARRPLHFRLRSTELVHDVYLRERSIDPDTVLALLPAKRLVPRPALLRTRTWPGWLSTPV